MEMMNVHWQKCGNFPFLGWCQFNSDLLEDSRLESRLETPFGVLRTDIVGVYIIWAGIRDRAILKVGSGIIKDRLRAHLRDPEIQAYKYRGLYATWASTTPFFKSDGKLDNKKRGIEKFLGIWLNPKLTKRLPNNVDAIWVNLPEWDPPVSPLVRALTEQSRDRKNPFSV